MQLIEVNKKRYRRHLAIVIVSCIVTLIIGSLSISQSLIALFPAPDGNHFKLNLIGVVVSSLIIGIVLQKLRPHPFMSEVVYVWDLKQALNKVTRKMHKIKPASEQGNRQAILALQFSYSGSRLLWHLDDNNIVEDELSIKQAQLDGLIQKYNLTIDIKEFSIEILEQF